MDADAAAAAAKKERLERTKREWMAKQAMRRAAASAPTETPEQTKSEHAVSKDAEVAEKSPLATLPQEEDSPSSKAVPRRQRTASSRGQDEKTPEWRKGSNAVDVTAVGGVGVALRDELRQVDKDLTAAMLRYSESSGSAGVRRGLKRLEGQEQSRWAYLDESNVSNFHDAVPELAMTFPFELDVFQKRAIIHVEAQESVFVAAHTSAGKTVVAEYAIALAGQFGAKVFYTSPIKTLSNQKLRDFRTKFKDVGLVTGDVSINEDAQCVIMTTEILRSMLYRGADVIRDVTYVIFDEVQFLNDEERGVVWEESIIMLPPHVSIIMLSATVPNALEFASWVGKTKNRKVAVVSTTKRPVPLQHSWLHRRPDTPDELREATLLEQGGTFLADNFRQALREAKSKSAHSTSTKEKGGKNSKANTKGCGDGNENSESGVGAGEPNSSRSSQPAEKPNEEVKKSNPKGSNKNKGPSAKRTAAAAVAGDQKGPNSRRSPWMPLVRFLNENDRTPTVIFCFSKKKCERAVTSLETSDFLPDSGQKAFVKRFFQESVVQLREEDRNLPQVLRAQANLERGVSAHHAGLLPLIKEITEILFSKGLVKVLFATETFAMGVNMPARTVVFAALRKHDGRNMRYLEAGEYTQMSGRAGRRGLDKVGNVHLFFPPDEQYPDQRALEKVMTGDPISLKSAFRLTYNMILNVLRVDELRVEELMKQSFSEANDDTKSESISHVIDKARMTLGKLNADPDGCDQLDGEDMEQVNEENWLKAYVERLSCVTEETSKLTFRDQNSVCSEGITHGRVVVAETDPGLLSLAMVFSIVPRGDQKGPAAVRSDSRIWVAYIRGVVPNALQRRKHVSSVLLLPLWKKNGKAPPFNTNSPQITTYTGLVVGLKDIEASKVVYICGACDKVSANRMADQQASSKDLFYRRSSAKWRKPLTANASYLEGIVCKWRDKDEFPVELFDPVCNEPMESAESFADCGRESNGSKDRSKRKKRQWKVPQAYQTRSRLCFLLATDLDLGRFMQAEAGGTIGTRIELELLKRSLTKKVAALEKVKERLHRPNLLPEYEKRVQVLQKLGYVGEDGVCVQLKGRCACNVATVDSVILTEIVLENALRGLEPAEVASLLSSLVCRAKNAGDMHKMDEKVYSPAYREAKATLREVVRNVGKVQEEFKVEPDVEFADGGEDFESAVCRWDLAHAVYAWANGEPFCEITNLTEQQEGDIVVCVKRVSELLRDAQSVSKMIGNDELHQVLEQAIQSIRRDVIFNGSLYYQDAAPGQGSEEEPSEPLEFSAV